MKECLRHGHGCGWDYIFYFSLLKGGCCDEYRELLPFNINWLPCKLKLYTINCDRRFHVWQITCHILCIISLHHPSIHPKPSRPFENQSCYESEWFCGDEVFPKLPGSAAACGSLPRLWPVVNKTSSWNTLGELSAFMRSPVSLTTCVRCIQHCLTKLNKWNTMNQIRKHNTTSCLPTPPPHTHTSCLSAKINKYLFLLTDTITSFSHKVRKQAKEPRLRLHLRITAT